MQNYCVATVEGFITENPEIKTTRTGKKVCTFSLAISHYSKNDEPPKVSFIDVETWNEMASKCCELKKGQRIMAIGTLRQDKWEDENGKTSSRFKVIADAIKILK